MRPPKQIPSFAVRSKLAPSIEGALLKVEADLRNISVIDRQLRSQNIFEILKVHRRELQHSNFLAYLLDPALGHGLGASFLKGFVSIATNHNRRLFATFAGAHKRSNLTGAYVIREWDRTDILVRHPTLRCLLVIENKIGDQERLGQLRGYRERFEALYPDHTKLFVYLTPERHEPSDQKWIGIGYSSVVGLLEKLMRRSGKKMDTSNRTLIQQYCQTLRRHVVKDTELVARARGLYEKHQRAFDFIFQNRPSYAQALHDRLRKLIKKNKGLRLDSESPEYFRFVPKKWDRLNVLHTKKSWDGGSLLTCEMSTPIGEDQTLDLHITIHVRNSEGSRALGRKIYETLEKRKLTSKSEYLWVRKRRISMPADINDTFVTDVLAQVNLYCVYELPKISREIGEVTKAFSKRHPIKR